jgi:hypothetical protein
MASATLKAFTTTSTGDNNIVMAVGNPDSVIDPLHEFIGRKRVTAIRISGLDHPNVVLNREIVQGAISVQSIEDKKDTEGEESDFYKSRVRGISPSQSVDSLIRLDWIDQCILHSDKYVGIEEDFSNNALGIDVAQSEKGDKAALAWGEKNTLNDVHEFYCKNASHLAYNVLHDDLYLQENNYTIYHTDKIYNYNIQPENIGVDAVGVGVGTLNVFTDNNYAVQSLQGGQNKEFIPLDAEDKPFWNFANLRSQMYWQLAQDLQHARIIIAIEDKNKLNQLKMELVTPKYSSRSNGILVEPKEKIKKRLGKSPNMADAVVYWNWVRVERKFLPGEMPFI